MKTGLLLTQINLNINLLKPRNYGKTVPVETRNHFISGVTQTLRHSQTKPIIHVRRWQVDSKLWCQQVLAPFKGQRELIRGRHLSERQLHPRANSSTTNPTWTSAGSAPGLRG